MSNALATKPLVGILMGSDSDWPTMKTAAEALKEFGVASEAKVISAHRDPHGLEEYVSSAITRGLKVIICGAGGAAHLAGVTAAFTTLPVIGVPILGKSTDVWTRCSRWCRCRRASRSPRSPSTADATRGILAARSSPRATRRCRRN
ncbi:MAG: AIR carboxylase family protein [Limisphaerales bacterium]